MRRYDDLVEVRRGPVATRSGGPGGPGAEGPDGPEQFLWRGRLWKVRAVVARWVETEPWWQSALVGALLLAEREIWRVEAACPGPRVHTDASMNDGVFDLSHDVVEGRWRLVGCQD